MDTNVDLTDKYKHYIDHDIVHAIGSSFNLQTSIY